MFAEHPWNQWAVSMAAVLHLVWSDFARHTLQPIVVY